MLTDSEKTPDVILKESPSKIDLQHGDEALQLIQEMGYSAANFDALSVKFDEAYYKRLTRKIDMIVLPLLAGAYFLQFLDKSLLNYAAIMGLREDANLKGLQYNNIAAAFSYGQLAWQFPTVWLAQKSGRIGTYLGLNLVVWGICLGCTAACSSFGSLFATRFLLGMFEACVAPVLVLIVSMWYPKYSQGRRIMVFCMLSQSIHPTKQADCMNGFTEILGALIAYGLSGATTKLAPWRILYLLFGCLTILHGVLCILFLPNSPVRAKFFSQEEKMAVLLRVKENQSGTQNQEFKLYQVLEILVDPKVLCNLFLVILLTIPNGALANFSSILLVSFGFTKRRSLLLQTPKGAVAFLWTFVVGISGDLLRDRSSMITICLIMPLIGAAILVARSEPRGLLLAAIYMTGTYGPSYSAQLSWNASNVAGYSKKTATYALTQALFAVGNIAGTYTFPISDAPAYRPGKITQVTLFHGSPLILQSILACLAAGIVFSQILRFLNTLYNKKHARARAQMDPVTLEEKKAKMAWADETDLKNPFFKYTY